MIDEVQDHLEAIYGLAPTERARAYLVDPQAAASLGATGRAPEELLVLEEGEELSVGLYLDPALLERLSRYSLDSLGKVLEPLLDSYCQLAEGVSHFLYLLQAASLGRRVSLLELEAQAEIDKFASCLLQRWGSGSRTWPQELHRRLFDRVRLRGGLSGEERWRYQMANRLSRNYCQRLLPLALARRLDRLLSELRYCYRLGAAAKLDYLAQPA